MVLFNWQPFVEVETEPAIRRDVMVDQRCERPPVFWLHRLLVLRLGQHSLNEEGVNIHEAYLQQMERQGRQALLLEPVGGKLPTFAVEDERVRAIPVLDDIEALVNLAAQFLRLQILADYVELIVKGQ